MKSSIKKKYTTEMICATLYKRINLIWFELTNTHTQTVVQLYKQYLHCFFIHIISLIMIEISCAFLYTVFCGSSGLWS